MRASGIWQGAAKDDVAALIGWRCDEGDLNRRQVIVSARWRAMAVGRPAVSQSVSQSVGAAGKSPVGIFCH